MKRNNCIIYGPEFESGSDRLRWIEHASRGLRVVGTAHDIAREEGYRRAIDHTGWHLDPWGDGDTVHGAVLQLPARDRAPRYVPAVSDPVNDDCYAVDFHAITDCKMDAARWADGLAEQYAEHEREYQLQESAKLRAEDLREEACKLRDEHRALVAEMRMARSRDVFGSPWPVICARLRADLAALRARVRKALKDAARIESNPYSLLGG